MALTLTSGSERATHEIGRAIGGCLRAGDLVALSGELGSGKTLFVKGLAESLGCSDSITSPTFVYVHEHGGRLPLAHLDLYRLNEGADIESFGVSDYVARGWIVVVEWADRAAAQLPSEAIWIEFRENSPSERVISIRPPEARVKEFLRAARIQSDGNRETDDT